MYHGVPTTLSTYFKISVLDFATLLIIYSSSIFKKNIMMWWLFHKYKVQVGWGEWGGTKAEVQVFRRMLHIYIQLDFSKIEFLFCIKNIKIKHKSM